MPAPETPKPSAPTLRWAVVLAVLGILFARLWNLDSDNPLWMPEATPVDEALWADGARGLALFGDAFADDTGNAWLIAPLYNFVVWGSYSVFGVSLWSTRLVPVVCSLVLILVFGGYARRRFGPRDGLLLTVALSLSPFLWAHSRFGLLEVPQATCIAAAFVLLFGRNPAGAPRALLAGLFMAAAMAIKPNTAVFGVAPLAAAWVSRWICGGGGLRQNLRDGLGAVVGGAAGLGVLALTVWVPHWEEVLLAWQFESGAGQGTVGGHLLRLGFVGSRDIGEGKHALWGPLRSAPLLTTAMWLYCLWTVLRLSWSGSAIRQRLEAWEWPVLVWCVLVFVAAEFAYYSYARRAVHMIVPMALLGGLWWIQRRDHAAAMQGLIEPRRRSLWTRMALWALLSGPVGMTVKPSLANALRPVFEDWMDTGSDKALAAGAAGLAVLGLWLLAILGLTASRWDPQRLTARCLVRIGPTLVLLLGLAEVVLVGAHLLRPQFTTLEAQRITQEAIPEGAVVFGNHAALMVQGKRIYAIRWVPDKPEPGKVYSGPRPNFEAYFDPEYDGLPRYVITDADGKEEALRKLVEGQDERIRDTYSRMPLQPPVRYIQEQDTSRGAYRWPLTIFRRED